MCGYRKSGKRFGFLIKCVGRKSGKRFGFLKKRVGRKSGKRFGFLLKCAHIIYVYIFLRENSLFLCNRILKKPFNLKQMDKDSICSGQYLYTPTQPPFSLPSVYISTVPFTNLFYVIYFYVHSTFSYMLYS